ncbi:MAG TPA: hypothetical protein VMB52_04820 [Verrucomicrobiae bacterium]|nr:hypothetical protein [Verrucomicrobiae bacterium]
MHDPEPNTVIPVPSPPHYTKLWSIVIVMLIVAIVLCGVVAFGKSAEQHGAILNYSECIKAKDSTVQETYPETCLTSNGARFVNPTQQEPCATIGWSTDPHTCRPY